MKVSTLALVIIVTLGLVGVCNAAKLPPVLNTVITPPAKDVPETAAAFSGLWEACKPGTTEWWTNWLSPEWSGGGGRLAVARIWQDSSTVKAEGEYAWSGSVKGPKPTGSMRWTGEIKEGSLTFTNAGVTFHFVLVDSARLKGKTSRGAECEMVKVG